MACRDIASVLLKKQKILQFDWLLNKKWPTPGPTLGSVVEGTFCLLIILLSVPLQLDYLDIPYKYYIPSLRQFSR